MPQQRTIRASWILNTALLTAIVVLVGQILISSLGRYWTDSEIWAVSSSLQLFDSTRDFDFGMKPLFHLLLWLATRIPAYGLEPYDPSSPAMDAARILMSGNLCFLMASLFYVASHLRSIYAGFIAILILAFDPLWAENAIAIRSDLLAAPWIIWAFYFIVRQKLATGLISLILASLITPKAALLVFPLGAVLAFVPNFSIRQALPSEWKKLALTFSLLVAWIFLNTDSLTQAWSHFVNEMSVAQMGIPYFSLRRWIYVGEALQAAPWFWVALLIAIVKLGLRGSRHRESDRPIFVFAVVVFILFAMNPSKLPFFIAGYQPLFALAIGAAFAPAFERIAVGPALSRAPLLAAAIFLFSLTLSFVLQSRLSTGQEIEILNSDQRTRMAELSDYLKDLVSHEQRFSIYDGLGLTLDPQLQAYYIGPGQYEINRAFPQFVATEDFSLLLWTQKTAMLRGLLSEQQARRFVHDPWGLSRKAVLIDVPEGGRIPAAVLYEALRSQFTYELNGKTRVYIYSGNDSAKSVSPLPESLAAWPTDEESTVRFPSPGMYKMTIYPPAHFSDSAGFEDIFRFRRASLERHRQPQ